MLARVARASIRQLQREAPGESHLKATSSATIVICAPSISDELWCLAWVSWRHVKVPRGCSELFRKQAFSLLCCLLIALLVYSLINHSLWCWLEHAGFRAFLMTPAVSIGYHILCIGNFVTLRCHKLFGSYIRPLKMSRLSLASVFQFKLDFFFFSSPTTPL